MITYAVLFEEDDFIYCVTYDGQIKENIKLTHEEYKEWKKDKMEV